jgi:hypothetical protein
MTEGYQIESSTQSEMDGSRQGDLLGQDMIRRTRSPDKMRFPDEMRCVVADWLTFSKF